MLWIDASLPGWLDEPMLAVTILGHNWTDLPLHAVAGAYFLYRRFRGSRRRLVNSI